MTASQTWFTPQIRQALLWTSGIFALVALLAATDCSATGLSCGNLVQETVRGILVGGVYALVALGIVIINKASGVFNFAHGYLMLAGGMFFWQTFDDTPSTELSAILGVAAGLVIFTFMMADTSPNKTERPKGTATGLGAIQARLTVFAQSIAERVVSRKFILAAAAGIVGGLLVMAILPQIENEIIRGAAGALIGSIALGLAVERFTIRPLLGQPVLAAIMMTLAVGLLVQGAVALVWGTQPRAVPIFVEEVEERPILVQIGIDEEGSPIYQEVGGSITPSQLPNYKLPTEDLLGLDLSLQRNLVWGFAIAILSFLAFVLFFQFTSVGLAMRAVSENQSLAESVGLRVRTILAIAWAIAATMAMVAGVVQSTSPGGGVSAISLPPLAFRAFPAVLLGGLESITGALVGGLIIGVVETLATATQGGTTGQEFAPFAVLLVVLLIKPDGLFGQKRIDRV